jgi:peptidoglycan/LPS O-acetylase OafA/YrhL
VFALTRKLLDKSIGIWLVTQIFGVANTPSCLKNFATGSVNGALWTIFTEIQLYIVLGMTYKFLKKLSIKKWLVLLSAFAAINVLAGFTVKFAAAKIIERIFLPYAIWFFIGTFCYVYKEKMLPFLTKCFFPLTACYTVLRLLPISIPGYYADIAVGILCPLIVIGGVTYCRRFV